MTTNDPTKETTAATVTAAVAPAMYVRIAEPVSVVCWKKDGDHPAVTGGYTRWADELDHPVNIHSAKESKAVGRLGKVNFGLTPDDVQVQPGDFVLTHSDGFIEVCRPAEFEALYRKATAAEVAAAAAVSDDSVKIVVMKNEPELDKISPVPVGETLAQRIKNASAPGSRPNSK